VGDLWFGELVVTLVACVVLYLVVMGFYMWLIHALVRVASLLRRR